MRENDLLQHVYAANAALPGSVTIRPGDDMGAVDFGGSSLLVAVDQVADGVHFELAHTPIEKIGRKAITRNLSDVAAMAAKPTAAVAAVCLPRDFGEANATALFDAMRRTAEAFACPLVGGDISMWDGQLLISVTVFAEPWRDAEGQPLTPVQRRGARPGDAIYVTGELGHSFLTGHHLDFTPRLELAHHLVAHAGGKNRPTAMIDVSDGIAQDLPRLVEHAEVHARILPIRDHPSSPGREAWQHALGDGEDYELMFTAPEDADIPHAFGDDDDEDQVLITRIGTVTDAGGITVITPENQRLNLSACFTSGGGGGWEHTG
ncbi:MAG: thiamine-phosphate kinase [Planctomycetota bacterium]